MENNSGKLVTAFYSPWLPLISLVPIVALFEGNVGPRDALRWVGLILSLIGVAGVIVARYTLGKSFSVTAQARALVTRGIYAKIRNPIYVSGGFLIAGLILIAREEKFWLVFAAMVVAQVVRARKEAKVLEAKFGDEYRRYRERTWF